MAAAKTVLAAAKTSWQPPFCRWGSPPPPEIQSSSFYVILDWRLEMVIVNKRKNDILRPSEFDGAPDPHPMVNRRIRKSLPFQYRQLFL